MGKSKEALGIDLGASAIKVVKVRRTGRGVQVVHAAVLPVERPTDDPYSVGQPDLLLRGHLSGAGLSSPSVVCSIDRTLAVVRTLALPAAAAAERAKMVRYEAEALVPFPIDSVELGHAELPGGGDGANTVIAACPRDRLRGRMGFFAGAGVQPTEMAVSTLATYNCFMAIAGEQAKDATLLLDIGGKKTEIIIVAGGGLLTSLSFTQGGEQLTECLAKDLQIDKQEAETHKRTVALNYVAESGLPPGDMATTRQWFSRLYEQVRRALDAHGQDGGLPAIQRIALCGGNALIPDVTSAIQAGLGLPVSILDPLASLEVEEGVAKSAGGSGAALVTAIGLALQGVGEASAIIDLKPAALESGKERSKGISLGPVLGVVYVAALVAAYMFVSGGAREKQDNLDALQQQIDRLESQEGAVDLGVRDELGQYQAIVAQLSDPHSDWLATLTELSEVLPVDMWLRALSFEKGKDVSLRGRALSNAAVSDAVDALERVGRYERVRLVHSSAIKIGGRGVYEFEIRCELPSDEDADDSRRTRRR